MTKLCPRGKAAAKRKFAVYPSAYANAYASKICAGKIKDPSGKKRKDFRGPKPSKAMGGRIFKKEGGSIRVKHPKGHPDTKVKKGDDYKGKTLKQKKKSAQRFADTVQTKISEKRSKTEGSFAIGGRIRKMGGGMTMMPRAMYKKGGKSFPDLSGDGKVTMKDILMGRGVIPRKGKKGGGLMEATSRLRAQGLKAGGVAKGCGAVMNDRRKVTKMY